MCGIAGHINFDSSQPVDKSILRHMLDQLRHRGPDDRGEKQFQLPNGEIAV